MSKLFDKCKQCVDNEVRTWGLTELSSIEQWFAVEKYVQGIGLLSMYVLDFKEYNDFKKYICDTYGYDLIGGVDFSKTLYKQFKEQNK